MKEHYLYGVYNKQDQFIYGGYSEIPHRRVEFHRMNIPGFYYMKIEEKFVDPETRLIQRKIKEGCSVHNKFKVDVSEYYIDYEVGDIVYHDKERLDVLLERELKMKRRVLRKMWKRRQKLYRRLTSPRKETREYVSKEDPKYDVRWYWRILSEDNVLIEDNLSYEDLMYKYMVNPYTKPRTKVHTSRGIYYVERDTIQK